MELILAGSNLYTVITFSHVAVLSLYCVYTDAPLYFGLYFRKFYPSSEYATVCMMPYGARFSKVRAMLTPINDWHTLIKACNDNFFKCHQHVVYTHTFRKF